MLATAAGLRAEELLVEGLQELAAGHTERARQAFDTLVTRFPHSPAAARARAELGIMSRDAAAAPPASAAEAMPATSSLQPIGSSPVWEEELRRNASIQTMLRNEAGDRVFFSAGSAELGMRARAALYAQAQWLNRWREFEAAIEGHADEPGTETANVQLSAARAEAVLQRLVAEGVDVKRLVVVAQGRSQRLANCPESECSAQNRRAVTLVFTAGTRERLGLSAAPETASIGEPMTLEPAQPVGEERVGVAH